MTDKTKMSQQLQILQQELNKFEEEKEQVTQRRQSMACLGLGVTSKKEIELYFSCEIHVGYILSYILIYKLEN